MGYLLRKADAIEQNAEQLAGVEAEITRQAQGPDYAGGDPPMVDQIRFFADAARGLEGGTQRGALALLGAARPVGPLPQEGLGLAQAFQVGGDGLLGAVPGAEVPLERARGERAGGSMTPQEVTTEAAKECGLSGV